MARRTSTTSAGATVSTSVWRSCLTVQDPFGLSRRTIATETPTLIDVQKRKFDYTAVFISFTYALGGASKRPGDNFEFGGQRQAGQ